jgi:hypothetical protein
MLEAKIRHLSSATTSAQAENRNNAVAAGSPAAGEQLTASASN